MRNLSFRRGGQTIFDQLDLEIPHGKVTAILGPSGTGKTTLLRAIGGQLRADSGSVEVFGEPVERLGGKALAAMRRRIGMLFQHGALFTDLTVFENVAFPLREQTDLSGTLLRDHVLLKLEAVGLRGAASKYPRELSGGMSRRVALARAVVLDPELLMYDEPFAGQDPISMAVLLDLIRRLNDALDLTSIVVTHDIVEAKKLADRLYVLSQGRLLAQGSAADLDANDDPALRQFLDGLADGPVPFHAPAPPLVDQLMHDPNPASSRVRRHSA